MILGAHLPNGPITAADWTLVAQLGGAKFLSADHTPPDLHLLRDRAPDAHVVVRLPDSCHADGSPWGWREYVDLAADVVARWHAIGVRDFELDNEPMFQRFWGPDHAWDYQAWLTDVVGGLRRAVCPGVRLGMPALVRPWAPGWDWARQEAALALWRQACTGVADRFDWVAAHCYYQAPGDRYNPHFGAAVQEIHAWLPHQPILVTEAATSLCQVTPTPAPAVIEQRMLAEYPDWVRWFRQQPAVEGVYFFLLGGTPDWAGFRLTPAVVRALAGA
jgi:hypothetical protein